MDIIGDTGMPRMRLKSILEGFADSRSGNVAMMFGLLAIPLLVGAGIGIDMVRANEARSRLSEASDAAVLAAARAMLIDDSITDDAASDLAQRQFEANARLRSDTSIDAFDFSFDPLAGKFSLAVKGAVKTTLLAAIGKKTMPISILSEAKVAPPRVLEAVLVLDNTDSMDGAKMDALKDAANDLVDSIMAESENKVKVGIVPFSKYVNVGLSRRHASWINVPADYSEDEYACNTTYPDAVSSNCRTVSGTCSNDGVSYECSWQECDWDYGDPIETCAWETDEHVWNGCVGSRDYPLNLKDENFASVRVPGLLDSECTAEILPLTTDKSAVKAKINSLFVEGDTYIPIGLSWGLRLISSAEPFAEAISYEALEVEAGVKALILMTDGANTRSPTYPRHSGYDASLANNLTREMCDEIKAKKVFIHTIAFEVTDSTIQNLLRSCASDPSDYYDAGNAAELADAFNSIGDDLKRLALTR